MYVYMSMSYILTEGHRYLMIGLRTPVKKPFVTGFLLKYCSFCIESNESLDSEVSSSSSEAEMRSKNICLVSGGIQKEKHYNFERRGQSQKWVGKRQ